LYIVYVQYSTILQSLEIFLKGKAEIANLEGSVQKLPIQSLSEQEILWLRKFCAEMEIGCKDQSRGRIVMET
jgi:hypothetical protein